MKAFTALNKIQNSRKAQFAEQDEGGCWIYLKSGWNNGDGGEHAIHEDTWLDCLVKLAIVDRCTCEGCQNDRKKRFS